MDGGVHNIPIAFFFFFFKYKDKIYMHVYTYYFSFQIPSDQGDIALEMLQMVTHS